MYYDQLSIFLIGLFLNANISNEPQLSATLLDTQVYLETPEGIDLPLRPAGLPVRCLAFAIDALIRAVILILTGIVWLYMGKLGAGLASISAFLLLWWYMVFFEVFNQGRSPGKQFLGLQVIHSDGTPIGWPASLTRNLLRFVDLLPFAYCLGMLSILNSTRFQRLGDLAAGTLVVYQAQTIQRGALPDVPPSPTPVLLTLSEQQALLNFAERHQQLSSERQNELAAIIAPALHIAPTQAVTRLHGMARSILGQA